MSQVFYVSCFLHVVMGESSRCSGFVRVDKSNLRSDADFILLLQKTFDVGKIEPRRLSINDTINNLKKPNSQQVAAPTAETTYRTATLDMKCMTDVTDDPRGLYFIQFEATCRDGKKRSRNLIMHLDFSEISKSSQLKSIVINEYNNRDRESVSVFRVDTQKECFITAMTRLS